MKTESSINRHKVYPSGSMLEYKLAVIAKSESQEAYGIAVQDDFDPKTLHIKEIGIDKNLALSIIDTLNNYRIPIAHFLDVISDLMNE